MTAALILLAALFCPLFAGAAAPDKTPPHKIQVAAITVEGLPSGLQLPKGIVPSTPLLYDAEAVKRTLYALSRFFSENGYPYSKITTSIINNDSTDVRKGNFAARDDSAVVHNNDSTARNDSTVVRKYGNNDSTARNTPPKTITIRFAIDLDERVRNGPPLVLGVEKRVRMYHRDVRLFEGGLFNSADVDETLRRFSMRPYVREAAAASPVIVEGAPKGGDSLRSAVVPFTVAERRGMEVEGALGYESGRGAGKGALSGRLDLSLMNMLRRGENAGVSYAGTDAFQRFKLSASQPWVFGLPLEAGAGAGLEIEDEGYGYVSGELWAAVEINARWKLGAAVNGSETVPPYTVGDMYRYYGADVFMALIQAPWERGRTVRELSARAGSGAANREKSYTRSKMELSAGAHCPVFREYALAGRACAKSLFTEEEYLPPAEMYRIGGHGSLRGYSEDEFALRSALFAQIEALYYFSQAGAVFVFVDGGAGFETSVRLSMPQAKKMLGYGAGVRFPSRLGAVSLEWARNRGDGWNLGRVHVGVRAGM